MNTVDVVRECAHDVNDELGPGLRENCYQKALALALSERDIKFTTEATIPVLYRGFPVARMHPDLIVSDGNDAYIVELKVDSDGSGQAARYVEYAQRNDMGYDGGIAVSFGRECSVDEV